MLKAQVCNLAISISHISLINFHLVLLLLLTSAYSCTLSLASEIRQPIGPGRQYAEVGLASLLFPPLEWITKWKWPQGSQVHPDQLTAPSLSRRLSQTHSLSEGAEPSPSPKDPHKQLASLWLFESASCGYINIRIVLLQCSAQSLQWRKTASLCAEIKPQDLFFILKEHSWDLLLHVHNVEGLTRDLKQNGPKAAWRTQRWRYSDLKSLYSFKLQKDWMLNSQERHLIEPFLVYKV